MRKIILSLAVSLDGFIEDPKGQYDWCINDQSMISDLLSRVDSLLIGRKTYELIQSLNDGELPPMTKLIVSNSIKKVDNGAVLIGDDLKKEIEAIKNKTGKDIWLFGGATLASSMMNLDLIDEIQLALHPTILGGGKPLFQKIISRKNLDLKECQSFPSGLVKLVYQSKSLK